MMTNKGATPLEEVLYEFSLEKTVPDAELLEVYVKRFPEYAAALTDLAVAIALDTEIEAKQAGDVLGAEVSPAVSRAMSRFHNRLFDVQQRRGGAAAATAASQQAAAENPFLRLDKNQFRQFAQGLHCNNVFVGLLRDREIIAETMTDGFKHKVAEELQAPIELVAAHFAAPAAVAQGQHYKTDDKPQSAEKIPFDEAVRKSGLSLDQQNFLMEL